MRRSIIISLIVVLALSASTASAGSEISSIQREISRIVSDLRKEFEASSDVQNARAMLRKTTADYREACDAALVPLRESTDYRLHVIEIQKLEQKISWGRIDDHMTDQQIAQTAKALLEKRLARSALDAKAIAASTDVSTARFAMMDANGALIGLHRAFNQSIVSNPEFAQAKDRLDAARANVGRRH